MAKNFDCITIGAGLLDTFVQLKQAHHHLDGGTEDECFSLGAKIDISQIRQQSGGGATNAAVTMVRQRLTSAIICRIGQDSAGYLIRKELVNEGVSTEYIKGGGRSGQSVILVDPNAERTILTDRGAGGHLTIDDLSDLEQIKARWVYLTSQNGQAMVIEQIMTWAERNSAKVAWNPGLADLSLRSSVRRWIKIAGLLLMNKDEANYYLETRDQSVNKLAIALKAQGARKALITDGPNELAIIDDNKISSIQPTKIQAVDQTGAGDAFGSGTVAGLLEGLSFKKSIELGLANSTSVVKQIGAKAGIIYREE